MIFQGRSVGLQGMIDIIEIFEEMKNNHSRTTIQHPCVIFIMFRRKCTVICCFFHISDSSMISDGKILDFTVR